MGQPTDEPAGHYDRVTRAWGYLLGPELHYGLFGRPDEPLSDATVRLTERMAEAARLEPGLDVLDVGCGTGTPAMWIAERHGCAVLGISNSEVGVELARLRAVERGLDQRCRFQLGDGVQNGLPDRAFDRAWILESSHLMPRKSDLIRESARILQPGGRLALCDIILHRDLGLQEVLRHAKEFHLLRLVFGRAKMETLATYEAWMQDAGLVVDVCDDLSETSRPTFDRWRENARRYESEVTELIGREGWQQFTESCDVLDAFWERRTLGYGLMAAYKPEP